MSDDSNLIDKNDAKPLVINDYTIVYRKEDGYVDVTTLCKASGKKYNHWNSLEKTQAFIKVLSSEAGIPASKLIEVISGGKNEDRKTWAHPQVAINIAQWISPEFDIQVSKWINNIKKESETTKDLTQIKEYKFGTSDLVVPIRADGMINATALCKAANKLIGHYLENKNTKAYLHALENNIGIPMLELIKVQVGGNYNGTWIHRKVGYHLAQWLSPEFALQMENILDELKNNEKQIIIKEVKPLVINNYSLVYRKEDGYVDVTNLCKAGGKEFKAWNRLDKTHNFLNVLSSEVKISTSKLIEVISGGNFKNQGTWAHPQVVINIAQWISPEFDVQVSKWIFELMITGKVELGNEKSNEELETIYKEKINALTNQLEITENQLETTENQLEVITNELEITQQKHNKLLITHNSALKKHSYFKFKQSGPCLYLFHSGYEYLDRIVRLKFGIAGTSDKDGKICTIDDRLKNHRTDHPTLMLDFLIFTKDAKFLEDGIKRYYRKEINPNGHEWLQNVSADQIIDRIQTVLDEFGIDDYNIVSSETLKKYNDYVITTVKIDEKCENDFESESDIDDEIDEEEIDEDESNEEEIDEDESNEEEIDEEEKDESEKDTKVDSVIEEKIDNMQEQMNEYKQILDNLSSYTVKKMEEILKKLGQTISGTKDVKIKKIKDKLEPIIYKKPLTKVCDTCNIEKEMNNTHFRKYNYNDTSFCDTCKACEFEKCSQPPVPIKPVVFTEITPGMKTLHCRLCKQHRSINDFYKNKSRGSRGHDYNCKNCETLRKCGSHEVREFKKKPTNIPENQKWCPKCETVKERSLFCPGLNRPDGLQYSCKICTNKHSRSKKTLNKLKSQNGVF